MSATGRDDSDAGESARRAGSDRSNGEDTVVDGEPRSPSGAVPERIGRYVVLERIGMGGMGVVHAAWDPELDRRVAIKLLRTVGDDDVVERLRREARSLAMLAHPNVLTVYEQGTLDGRPWIATELVDGEDLRQWLRGGERPWRAVLELLLAAARGLAAAHDVGLVHRDFKPDNVLVDRQGRPRVADFGVARSEGDAASGEGDSGAVVDGTQSLTALGTVVGTIPYMAPEHARGRASALSDQFSFCVTAFEALCGARPFVGADARAIRQAIDEGRITRPAGAARVPAWVLRIVERGLAARPDDRHASMQALIDGLERGRAHRRRLRNVAAVLGVVGLAAAAAATFDRSTAAVACEGGAAELEAVWGPARRSAIGEIVAAVPGHGAASWRHAAGVVDAWTADWQRVHRETCEAAAHGDRSGELLDRSMACLRRHRGELAAIVALLETADADVLDRVPELVGSLAPVESCADERRLHGPVAAPVDPAALARVDGVELTLAQARASVGAGRYQDAIDAVRPALAEAQALGWPPLTARAHLQLGIALDRLGDPDAAAQSLRAATEEAELGRDDAVAAEAWLELVVLEGFERGDDDAARMALALAEAKLDRIGAGPAMRAELEHARAASLLGSGDADGALAAQERALALWAESPDLPAITRANAFMDHGTMLHSVARHAEALVAIEQARELCEETIGPSHPSLGSLLGNLCAVHYALGDLPAARVACERSVALLDGAVAPDAPVLAKALGNLGVVRGDQGDVAAALQLHQRAFEIRERTLGPTHSELALAHSNLGATLMRLDRVDEAIGHHEKALAIRSAAMGSDHPWNGYPHTDLGRAYLVKGDPQRAREHLERALQVRLSASGPDPVEVGETRNLLARALVELGVERARALELARQARDAFVAAGEPTDEPDAVLRRLGVATQRGR